MKHGAKNHSNTRNIFNNNNVSVHTHARTNARMHPPTLFFWLTNNLTHSIKYNKTKFFKQQNTKIKTLNRPQHINYRQHLWIIISSYLLCSPMTRASCHTSCVHLWPEQVVILAVFTYDPSKLTYLLCSPMTRASCHTCCVHLWPEQVVTLAVFTYDLSKLSHLLCSPMTRARMSEFWKIL